MDSHMAAQLAFGLPTGSRLSRLGSIFRSHSGAVGSLLGHRGLTRTHKKTRKHHRKHKAVARRHTGIVIPKKVLEMMVWKAVFRELSH
jgi:hypothetical protein